MVGLLSYGSFFKSLVEGSILIYELLQWNRFEEAIQGAIKTSVRKQQTCFQHHIHLSLKTRIGHSNYAAIKLLDIAKINR